MPCPRCGGALSPREAARKATFHACEGHGGFIAHDELQHALPFAAHAALEEARERAPPGPAECPMCGRAMGIALLKRGHDSIELDVCHHCGGCWFDTGELERARAAPKGTGHVGAAPEHARALSGGGDAAAAAVFVADPAAWVAIVEFLGGFFE